MDVNDDFADVSDDVIDGIAEAGSGRGRGRGARGRGRGRGKTVADEDGSARGRGRGRGRGRRGGGVDEAVGGRRGMRQATLDMLAAAPSRR